MAENNNAQIVAWANNRARPLADLMTRVYYAMTSYQSDYAAAGMAALIAANTPTNVIQDGSDQDGRVQITGTSLQNFNAAITQLLASYGTNVTGVGSPVTTIQNGIQVNGSPR